MDKIVSLTNYWIKGLSPMTSLEIIIASSAVVTAVATIFIAINAWKTFQSNKIAQELLNKLSFANAAPDVFSRITKEEKTIIFANAAIYLGFPHNFYDIAPRESVISILGDQYFDFLGMIDGRDKIYLDFSKEGIFKLGGLLRINDIFNEKEMCPSNHKSLSEEIKGIDTEEVKKILSEIKYQVERIFLLESKNHVSSICNKIGKLIKKIDWLCGNEGSKENVDKLIPLYVELREEIYGKVPHFNENQIGQR